jgi:hypothetical protein
MGWSSGSKIFDEIAEIIFNIVDDPEDRKLLYSNILGIFADHDCDTLDECDSSDPVLKEVFKEMGLIEFDENDEDEEDDWPDGGREMF